MLEPEQYAVKHECPVEKPSFLLSLLSDRQGFKAMNGA
jgi:hypothetical protein